ncbi:MAG: hypothetical protein PQ964_02405 [Methanobacteriaceae archaeon]
MNKDKISLEELYYVLMSSWIYSIEKTREELFGEDIAYNKRIGWNAAEYIVKRLDPKCLKDVKKETSFETLRSIIKCLEDIGFIKTGAVTVKQDKNVLSIEITNCAAEACKELVRNGIMPQACLRSIILDGMLELITDKEYAYKRSANPESQPFGVCITYLSELE